MASKTYKGKPLTPGGGGKFAQMEDALQKKGYSKASATKITAAKGIEKYGQSQMTEWAQKGKKRAAKSAKKR